MVTRLILLTYVSLCVGGLNAVLYDCVSGKPANKAQLRIYERRNNTGICTIDVKPCDPKERQRLDGSCNNLKWPSRGTHRTPSIRLLPLDFSPNYEPRKAADGGDLELPRRLRTKLLSGGRVSDLRITQLVAYYILFTIGDVNSIHDPLNYLLNIKYCCEPEGKKDPRCTPIKVPVDDPVHRFSGVGCMNLTKPQSFQTFGCLDNGTKFVRINFQNSLYDLSNTYNPAPGNIDKLRTYKKGLLKIEKENGALYPPSDPTARLCFLNQLPREKRCNLYQPNNAIGPNLINIMFYRQHNVIAKKLCKLNPSWDDERLFFTARDINIAISQQILLYELLPILLGKNNMIREGIISEDGGFRCMYDKNMPPQISDEYIYVHRWYHTIQEATLKFYDKDGYFVKTFPLVNATGRTGLLTVDNNAVHITQGMFRQPGAAADHIIDSEMANRVFGGTQFSSDVGASDLFKGRTFGMPPYTKFREYCKKKSYESFSDLIDSISPERLYRLKQSYKSVPNIDLMAGLWVENIVKGGKVPETLYCIVIEELKRILSYNRFHYECPKRPHAFTEEQLKAIRKVTIAGVLCTVGDGVTEIQQHAFRTISSNNPLIKCSSSKIGKLDLTPWNEDKYDFSCDDNVDNNDGDEDDDHDNDDNDHHDNDDNNHHDNDDNDHHDNDDNDHHDNDDNDHHDHHDNDEDNDHRDNCNDEDSDHRDDGNDEDSDHSDDDDDEDNVDDSDDDSDDE